MRNSSLLYIFIASVDSGFYSICYSRSGKNGLCMYQYECFQSGGTAIDVCRNGFQFGACCVHDVKGNEVISTTSESTTQIVAETTIDSNIIEINENQGELMQADNGIIIGSPKCFILLTALLCQISHPLHYRINGLSLC